MDFSLKQVVLTFTALIFFYNSPSKAEPWIDTSDLYLKASIQLLADSGHIITPVTTYPLMWKDIARDLSNIDSYLLTELQQVSFDYVKFKLASAKKNKTIIRAGISSEGSRFTSFGDKNRYQHSVQMQSSFMTDSLAVKVAPGTAYVAAHTLNTQDDKIFDGSYIAGFAGNWVVSFGKQDRWYGPQWDSSFSLTNNAQPIPALSLSRMSAQPVKIPFTNWQVPWTVTSFMGVMDDNRTIENALLWGFRLNFKPFKNLEIGITRLAQWGGNGRSHSLGTFWDVLLGKTNCGLNGVVCDENSPNPANQQAGWDMRYSFNLFQTPLAFYGNYFAEDGDNNNKFSYVTKAQVQLGLDAQIMPFNIPTTAFIEYGDSLADCGERDELGDCYYEHGSYTTGMRYKGRTISNLYDNDAKTIVIGTISHLQSDIKITNKLRWLDLNYDNSDRAPEDPMVGNPLASSHETMIMLSTNIEHSYKQWRYSIGGDFSHSRFEDDIDDNTEININLNIEYML